MNHVLEILWVEFGSKLPPAPFIAEVVDGNLVQTLQAVFGRSFFLNLLMNKLGIFLCSVPYAG